MGEIKKVVTLIAAAIIAICLAAALAKASSFASIRLGYDHLGWIGILAFMLPKAMP